MIDSFALGSSDAPSGVLSVALFVNVENSSEILARAKRGELDAALADPATFSGDPRRAAELGKARSEAQAALDAAESAWLEAVEALEALRA